MLVLLVILCGKYLIYISVLISIIYLFLQSKDVRKKILLMAVFTLPVAFVIAKVMSNFYYSTRPFVSGHFTPLISHAANNGFPSNHALLSFTLASVIFTFNKKVGGVLFLFGVMISVSRVYAGIHSPVDILGAAVVGILVSFICYQIIRFFKIN